MSARPTPPAPCCREVRGSGPALRRVGWRTPGRWVPALPGTGFGSRCPRGLKQSSTPAAAVPGWGRPSGFGESECTRAPGLVIGLQNPELQRFAWWERQKMSARLLFIHLGHRAWVLAFLLPILGVSLSSCNRPPSADCGLPLADPGLSAFPLPGFSLMSQSEGLAGESRPPPFPPRDWDPANSYKLNGKLKSWGGGDGRDMKCVTRQRGWLRRGLIVQTPSSLTERV